MLSLTLFNQDYTAAQFSNIMEDLMAQETFPMFVTRFTNSILVDRVKEFEVKDFRRINTNEFAIETTEGKFILNRENVLHIELTDMNCENEIHICYNAE
jgi:hypothetical protein